MRASVLLENPKSPYNVGGVLRACHIFGADTLLWTGTRVLDQRDVVESSGTTTRKRYRLPREERLKEYNDVLWLRVREDLDSGIYNPNLKGFGTPVAVEVSDSAEDLRDFVHPDPAIYLFGPEDGSISKRYLAECHRFVRIPSLTRTPLNLAAAVNLVLYDRYVKENE